MAAKVNLDALIPRDDFEVQDNLGRSIGRSKTTMSVNDLKEGEFFFAALRKPDFQRETNEWGPDTICKLIESFLGEDLIPAIILWRSAGSPIFVIDGSHRISALAAWINDDYGDGDISRRFYETEIPPEQLKIAERTRTLIKKRVGLFKHYQNALADPQKYSPDIADKARNLGALAIQLQWVEGDARKAEASFFSINQQGAPIDSTELRILKSREKPHAIAARAIVRSGKGHKYWSGFSGENQLKIQEVAREIHDMLFKPPFKTPVKTLDLPVGGKTYSAQTLPLIFDFITIVNPPPGNGEHKDDEAGSDTIDFLIKCKRVAERINSNHPSSLGLHPAVYFYSQTGRHKPASFHAFTSLILEFERRNFFKDFIKVREPFEKFLIEFDYFNQQIVRKYRSAGASYEHIKDFYLAIITKLLEGKSTDALLDELLKEPRFSYLIKANDEVTPVGKDFSSATKSKAFLREALSNALQCRICGGYMHTNSISIDHITRKADGGSGTVENAQLAHLFCNTTVKH